MPPKNTAAIIFLPTASATAAAGNNARSGQWHECALNGAGAPIVAGSTYWLAVLSPGGNSAVSFRDRVSGTVSVASAQSNLTALPRHWASGQSFANGPLAGYVLQR